MLARIGVDFGGVIVKPRNRTREDADLNNCDGVEIAQEGVFEAIRELVDFSSGSVWIVSKAGSMMQNKTRDWLEAVDFFNQTGLQPENVHFCLERPEKEEICRSLKITHFVDDRVHNLQILRYTVRHLYLFGLEDKRKIYLPWATYVTKWMDLVNYICRSSEGG